MSDDLILYSDIHIKSQTIGRYVCTPYTYTHTHKNMWVYLHTKCTNKNEKVDVL